MSPATDAAHRLRPTQGIACDRRRASPATDAAHRIRPTQRCFFYPQISHISIPTPVGMSPTRVGESPTRVGGRLFQKSCGYNYRVTILTRKN
jgi:hypothetical protein